MDDTTGNGGKAVYNPHPGVECCPCVERLRQQNHAAAAAMDKRHAEDRSELDGLRHLMREARDMHRKGHVGISSYGQAMLAEALRVADEAEAEVEMLRIAMQRERRARIVAEDKTRRMREAVALVRTAAEPSS